MTDIMAAIGLRQLDRYPTLLERRKEIIKKYDEACDELGVIHLQHYYAVKVIKASYVLSVISLKMF